MKIATLTLNPAIDRAYYGEDIGINKLNRAVKTTVSVGSKGINVSRVMRLYGVDSPAYCFAGGAAGRLMEELLNIPCVIINTKAETRINIKLIDVKNDTYTEINESGGPIEPFELDEMLRELDSVADSNVTFFSLGGSIPPGIPKTVYADIISMMRLKNIPCALDCDGDALKFGIEQRPYIIKPNKYELELFAEHKFDSVSDLGDACRKIYEKYGCIVLCTLGADGAVVACHDGLFRVGAHEVKAIGSAGAGDTFLAAFLYSHLNGHSMEESLITAASAAAAKVTTEGTEMPSPERLTEYTNRITINKM